MKVTESDISKHRKSLEENCLQKISAEQKEYAEVCESPRMTETDITNANEQTERLLEKILAPENVNKAYKQVKKNKGAGGIDGMTVEGLLPYLETHKEELLQSIWDGSYRPKPVRRVEIPKENGKTRKLGIPTVIDRLIQQAISQVLTPIYESQFSDNSFGFRPKRSAHDALKRCQTNITDGYTYVVDMDLEKYFDTVNQSKLVQILSETIKAGRVISLIHKFLGYAFYVYKGEGRLKVHPKSIRKLKDKIREITGRSNGMGIKARKTRLNQIIRGWANYFKLADMKQLMQTLDEWLRSRIRMITWKRWKKVKTRFKNLKSLGVDEERAWMWANTRKGYWRTAHSPILTRTLFIERFKRAGYFSFADYYSEVRL